MSKIVWDTQQMYEAARSFRDTAEEFNGVSGVLVRDLGSLGAVRQALARYGIRPNALDAAEEYRQPSRALGQVGRRVKERSEELNALVNLLNDIEREAEARNGRLGAALSPQLLAQVDQQRRELLGDKRLTMLLGLRTLVERQSRPPAESANLVRLWLEAEIPDAETRLWVVEKSPDIARLLAENVDEADAAVRELRTLTAHSGSYPFDHFVSLSTERREWLAIAYPSLVGNLDGAPPEMRWTANRINLVAYREKLFDDLAVSQGQGYRVPARDESSLSLRMKALDLLLASPGGHRVLAFDKPDAITPMRVALDGADGGVSPQERARLMNNLAEAAGKQQGSSEALLRDLDTLSRSDDPAVARFGREVGTDLRTAGRIDPGKAAALLGKVEYPLEIAGMLADANQRIQEGDKPPEAVLGAIGKGASGIGGTAAAGAVCLATGVGALPCALIAVGGGVAGELLWDAGEASRDYAFAAAPGDVDSSTLSMYADTHDYHPEKYFIALPTHPQDIGPGQRAGIPRETGPLDGPWPGQPGQRGGVPPVRPGGWPHGYGD